MRVLVDGRIGGADGIGRYTTSVVDRLTGVSRPGVELTVLRAGTARRYSRAEGDELLSRALEYRADLLHTLDYRVPITAAPEISTMITVHDILRIVHPALGYSDADFADRFGVEGLTGLREAVDDLRDVAPFPARRTPKGAHDEFLGRMLALAVRRADRVITPTRAVARQLCALVPTSDKLCVTPWGVDHLPAPAGEMPPGVPDRFLLYVGQARPHKGLPALFTAASRTAVFGDGAPLVLVGRDMVPGSTVAQAAADALGPHRVVLLDKVSDAELALLYSRASALLHLADHEGFGFPPLEALHHGCPVVASDIPVLRETLDAQASFADPRDPEVVARSVDEVVVSDKPSLRAARVRWARRFGWKRHIDDLLRCYKQVGGLATAAGGDQAWGSTPDVPKLVFDVRSNHDTGVSRYGLSLLPAAAQELARRGWELDIVAKPVQSDRARGAVAGLGRRVTVHVDARDEGFLRRSRAVRDLAARADLYYTSHYLLDRLCPVPFVVTIHDLTRLRLPQFSYSDETFSARFGSSELHAIRYELAALTAWQDSRFAGHDTFTRYFVALNRFLTARAERVVTVSHTSSAELQYFFDLPSDGIDVVPGGVDTTVFRPRPASEVDAIRRHIRLPGPYLMFVGLTHPNKRLDWLVEQLLSVRDRMPTTARLVAVGGHAEGSAALRRLLGRAGAADFVVFPGRVMDTQLAALYSGAAGLVSASVSEGYGLPVQEALSCGCEVIAADIPATRETAGPVVHRFPPTSGRALADLACSALNGRLELRSSAHRPPSWEVSGRRLAHVLENAWRYSPRQDARIKA